jgi:hypothetical protein
MRRAIVATAIALSLATSALPAQADTPCTINNFSPRAVAVGTSPVVATFKVATSDCQQSDWSVEGDSFFVYESSPQEAFNPYSNSEAGAQDVIVTAYDADYDARQRVFANGFYLLRRAAWVSGSFNASPEPIAKGRALSLTGHLVVADWTNDRYNNFGYRTVGIEFRPKASSTYTQVKTVTLSSGGYLKTTVTASSDGYWRANYHGNLYASAGVSVGDYVEVN